MHTTETRIFTAIIIAALILLVFIAFFIAGIIRYHRITLKKESEKINADIMLLEQERVRLSADLHDEFGMLIAAIKIRLHCMELKGKENIYHVSVAEEHIDQLMHRIREVSADLVPMHLRENGLSKALTMLVENIAVAGKIKVIYHNSLPPAIMDKNVHIYRVIQEITNNALKHAGASQIELHLSGSKKNIIIKINDNGKGFDCANNTLLQNGLGLTNIARRIKLLEGKLYLDTAQGKGTHYLIEIPNKP